MKLSAYIKETQVDIMSMEEFNEVMDELEALVEANTAQARLVSLETLDVDTNTAQYRLAMETILIPVGLGGNESISAEDLKERIAGVASRLWARVLSALAAVSNRFTMMYEGLKTMMVKYPPEMTFLRSWKKAIKKHSPDTADAVIKTLDEKLKPIIHIPHRNAYTDLKLGSGLMDGGVKTNLAFNLLKITEEGENETTSSAGEVAVVPHNLPEIIKALGKVCKSGSLWMESLEKATKKMYKREPALVKRFLGTLISIKLDVAAIKKAQKDVTPIYIAFAHASKKYGDKPAENTTEN